MTKFDEKAEPFHFDGSTDHALLLIHGFTGSPAHIRLMGESLHEQTGLTVRGIRLSGHGTTPKHLRKFSWRDWTDDVREAFEDLQAGHEKVSLVGFSLGGLLSLKSAGELPVHRLVSIAAGVRLWHPPSRFLPILQFLPLKMKWHGYSAEKSKKSRRYLLDYHQGYTDFYYKSVADGMRFCRLVEESLPEVNCPVLVVQPQWDEQVDLQSADIILMGFHQKRRNSFNWRIPSISVSSDPSVKNSSRRLPDSSQDESSMETVPDIVPAGTDIAILKSPRPETGGFPAASS